MDEVLAGWTKEKSKLSCTCGFWDFGDIGIKRSSDDALIFACGV